jgi:hypothetical protein
MQLIESSEEVPMPNQRKRLCCLAVLLVSSVMQLACEGVVSGNADPNLFPADAYRSDNGWVTFDGGTPLVDAGTPPMDGGTRLPTDAGALGADAGSDSGADSGTSSSDGGRESWIWPYNTNMGWPSEMEAIAANVSSFTHLSPTFYTLNLVTPYSSGVADYISCAGGVYACSANGADDFGTWNGATLTTQAFTAWAHGLGLKVVPAIYAGASNGGLDTSVQAILCNGSSSGCAAQTNFISAMVGELQVSDYDGYNLDWEMGSGVGGSYASAFVAFVNAFKGALDAAGRQDALVTVDAIVSNVNGTSCSGNNGYLDFRLLQSSSIDRVIIEDYSGTFQSAGWTVPATCTTPLVNVYGSASLNDASPVGCDYTFTGMMIMMCPSNLGSTPALDMSKAVIGLMPSINGTNPIAGEAMALIQSYGFTKVAVWPQYDSNAYSFMSTEGVVPASEGWYGLLQGFLSH